MDELPISQIYSYIDQISEELINLKPKPFNSKVEDMVEVIVRAFKDYPKNIEGYELPKFIQFVPDESSLKRAKETTNRMESLIEKIQGSYLKLESSPLEDVETTNESNRKSFEEIESFIKIARAQTELVELKQFYVDYVDLEVFQTFAKDHKEDFVYYYTQNHKETFKPLSLKDISQKVHDSSSSLKSTSAYSGDRPFGQYFGDTINGQRYDIPKYSNANTLKQIMYFDANNVDWYMTVLDQIQRWKEITSPDAWGANTSDKWEGFKGGLASFGQVVGAVQSATNQLTTLLDVNKKKFQRYIQNYRKNIIGSVNDPKWIPQNKQSIQFGNQTNPTAYTVSHNTFEKNAATKFDPNTPDMANLPLLDLITNLRNNGLIFDNTYDVLIRRKLRSDGNEDDSQSKQEIKVLCLRSQGLNLEGKTRTTTKFKWKNNEEIPKPLNKFEQNKIQSITFDLDQNFFTLQKVAEYSNYLNYYEIQQGDSPKYFYKKFGSFIQPRNPKYRYDIEVVIYNGFSTNTNVESLLNSELEETEYATVYVYEDVKFLGVTSAPTYTVAGGDPLSFSTEFTYLRGYFNRENLKQKLDKHREEVRKAKEAQEAKEKEDNEKFKDFLRRSFFSLPEFKLPYSSQDVLNDIDWSLRPIIPTNVSEPLVFPSAEDLGLIATSSNKNKSKVQFGTDGFFTIKF